MSRKERKKLFMRWLIDKQDTPEKIAYEWCEWLDNHGYFNEPILIERMGKYE